MAVNTGLRNCAACDDVGYFFEVALILHIVLEVKCLQNPNFEA